MNEIIKIGNQELKAKEYEGQRVVTFKDIDTVHERPDGTAKRNFNSNKDRFKQGKHFYFVKPSDIRTDEIRTSEINNAGTYLISEKGYLMLVKSLNDELAWEVQEQLVDTYFDKPKKPLTTQEIMREQLFMLDNVADRVTVLENNMTIDYAQQLVLEKLVNKQVTNALGGKDSGAYKEISKKVFPECNRDIKNYFHVNSRNNIAVIDFDKARQFIQNWKPCYTTQLFIDDCNAQMCMN